MLFAKAPVQGLVKTRLVPAITAGIRRRSAPGVCERYDQSLPLLTEAADFELHTDMTTDEWADIGVTRKLQIPGDLGLKMIHALDAALQSGYRRALILGSDAPTLPSGTCRTLLASETPMSPWVRHRMGDFTRSAAGRVCHRMFDGVRLEPVRHHGAHHRSD